MRRDDTTKIMTDNVKGLSDTRPQVLTDQSRDEVYWAGVGQPPKEETAGNGVR